jgi:hypothetical protein
MQYSDLMANVNAGVSRLQRRCSYRHTRPAVFSSISYFALGVEID